MEYLNKENNDIISLFNVCGSGNGNIFYYLVEHDENIYNIWENGRTPLFYACGNGNINNILNYLVEYGIDINKNSETPLFETCERKHDLVVKYPVEHAENKDINVENEEITIKFLFKKLFNY